MENAAEPAQNEAQPSEAMPSAEADDQEETGNADMNMKSDDHKQEADAKHPVPKSKVRALTPLYVPIRSLLCRNTLL